MKLVCLLIDNGQQTSLIAERDIIVYKTMKRITLFNRWTILWSPLKLSFWKLNKIKESEIVTAIFTTNSGSILHSIEMGLHSFGEYEDASQLARIVNGRIPSVVTIGIIPQGSVYYIGTFGGATSYASNQLVLTGFPDEEPE